MQWVAIAVAAAVLACKPAPGQLEIPLVVQQYICASAQAGHVYSTLLPVNHRNIFAAGSTAKVAFYTKPDKDNDSWIGNATFRMAEDGTLGKLLLFQWPDGRRWSADYSTYSY